MEIVAAVDNGADLLAAVTDGHARTWPSSTSGCRRRSPTRACGPRWPPGARCPGLPVLVLSQYVEQLYARELLADGSGGIGYLLKDRVFDSAQFVDAVRRVAGGRHRDGPGGDRALARPNSGDGTLATLSPREREVLALMAEGRSNAAIAQRLVDHRARRGQAHRLDLQQARTCSPPTTTTGGCSPSSPTWSVMPYTGQRGPAGLGITCY